MEMAAAAVAEAAGLEKKVEKEEGTDRRRRE